MADPSGGTVRVLGAIVVAIAVIVLAGVVVVALGVGPFAGNSTGDGGAPVTTEAPATADGDATESRPPFSFTIEQIEECGQTCRDVTATLHNNQNRRARNVTVSTRIYAGNTSRPEDRIWRGTESVGVVEAGDSAMRTQRVELSMSEALAVQRNDGWITVVTAVDSAEATVAFEDRRDVA